jgi:hypothetical protein
LLISYGMARTVYKTEVASNASPMAKAAQSLCAGLCLFLYCFTMKALTAKAKN